MWCGVVGKCPRPTANRLASAHLLAVFGGPLQVDWQHKFWLFSESSVQVVCLKAPSYKAKVPGPREMVVWGPPNYKTNTYRPPGRGGLRARELQNERNGPRWWWSEGPPLGYKTTSNSFVRVCSNLPDFVRKTDIENKLYFSKHRLKDWQAQSAGPRPVDWQVHSFRLFSEAPNPQIIKRADFGCSRKPRAQWSDGPVATKRNGPREVVLCGPPNYKTYGKL